MQLLAIVLQHLAVVLLIKQGRTVWVFKEWKWILLARVKIASV